MSKINNKVIRAAFIKEKRREGQVLSGTKNAC